MEQARSVIYEQEGSEYPAKLIGRTLAGAHLAVEMGGEVAIKRAVPWWGDTADGPRWRYTPPSYPTAERAWSCAGHEWTDTEGGNT